MITPEQKHILTLLNKDMTPKQIAIKLGFKPNSSAIRKRLQRARIAMGVKTTAKLLIEVKRLKLI